MASVVLEVSLVEVNLQPKHTGKPVEPEPSKKRDDEEHRKMIEAKTASASPSLSIREALYPHTHRAATFNQTVMRFSPSQSSRYMLSHASGIKDFHDNENKQLEKYLSDSSKTKDLLLLISSKDLKEVRKFLSEVQAKEQENYDAAKRMDYKTKNAPNETTQDINMYREIDLNYFTAQLFMDYLNFRKQRAELLEVSFKLKNPKTRMQNILGIDNLSDEEIGNVKNALKISLNKCWDYLSNYLVEFNRLCKSKAALANRQLVSPSSTTQRKITMIEGKYNALHFKYTDILTRGDLSKEYNRVCEALRSKYLKTGCGCVIA